VLPRRPTPGEVLLHAVMLLTSAPAAVAFTLISLGVLAGLLGYVLISWWSGILPVGPSPSSWLMP